MLAKFAAAHWSYQPGLALILLGVGFAVTAGGMLMFGITLRALMKVFGAE